jgi:hypothetical protein
LDLSTRTEVLHCVFRGLSFPSAPDQTLWGTTTKFRQLLEAPVLNNELYFEALGAVLAHELVRLHRIPDHAMTQARGGLAAWQQRVVAAYIDEHLAEPISLATLADLARLSPFHFCRAFKQSFGVPPTAITRSGASSEPRCCWRSVRCR